MTRVEPTWLRNIRAALEAGTLRGQVAVSVPTADLAWAVRALDEWRQGKGVQVGEG